MASLVTAERTIHLKLTHSGDLRRTTVSACDVATLIEHARKTFGLDSSVPLCLKYLDEEGDLITIANNGDVDDAAACSSGKWIKMTLLRSNISGLSVDSKQADAPPQSAKKAGSEDSAQEVAFDPAAVAALGLGGVTPGDLVAVASALKVAPCEFVKAGLVTKESRAALRRLLVKSRRERRQRLLKLRSARQERNDQASFSFPPVRFGLSSSSSSISSSSSGSDSDSDCEAAVVERKKRKKEVKKKWKKKEKKKEKKKQKFIAKNRISKMRLKAAMKLAKLGWAASPHQHPHPHPHLHPHPHPHPHPHNGPHHYHHHRHHGPHAHRHHHHGPHPHHHHHRGPHHAHASNEMNWRKTGNWRNGSSDNAGGGGSGRRDGGGGRVMGRFVHHVTCEDGSVQSPGKSFVKIWRLRNDSDRSWPDDCMIVPVVKHRLGTDQFQSPDSVPVPSTAQNLKPGQECDLQIKLVSPTQPGEYQGFWRLCDGQGRRFGQRLWVRIVVPDTSSSNSNAEDEGKRAGETKSHVSSNDSSAVADTGIATQPENPEQQQQFVYERELLLLRDAGFDNTVRNKKLLLKCKGNVERVLRKLKTNDC